MLALTAAMLLAACGQAARETHNTPTPAKAQPNAADVAFVQNMIPHHQQAIEMAELVDARTDRPELTKLAGDITASQGAEISKMQGWLQAWGKSGHSMDSMPGGDHGAMPGMMSEADMTKLTGLRSTKFDLAFVDMMIMHHQGAIEMAQTELREGSLPEVKQLAQQVITAQQAEIQQMETWKQAWTSLPPR
jgi:uncharacterized protein (DUF305 family)